MGNSKEQRKKEDQQVALTALVLLGWILPLAGLIWGPGTWWEYIIWLAIGTTLIILFDKFEKEEN